MTTTLYKRKVVNMDTSNLPDDNERLDALRYITSYSGVGIPKKMLEGPPQSGSQAYAEHITRVDLQKHLETRIHDTIIRRKNVTKKSGS